MDVTDIVLQWAEMSECVRLLPHPSPPAAVVVPPVGPVRPESHGLSHYLGAR